MTHATSDSNQAHDLLAWDVDGFSSCDLRGSFQTQVPARNFAGHLKKGALLEMLSLMSKRLAKSFQLLISHPGIVRKRIVVIRYCQILDTFAISELSFKLVCHACLIHFCQHHQGDQTERSEENSLVGSAEAAWTSLVIACLASPDIPGALSILKPQILLSASEDQNRGQQWNVRPQSSLLSLRSSRMQRFFMKTAQKVQRV